MSRKAALERAVDVQTQTSGVRNILDYTWHHELLLTVKSPETKQLIID